MQINKLHSDAATQTSCNTCKRSSLTLIKPAAHFSSCYSEQLCLITDSAHLIAQCSSDGGKASSVAPRLDAITRITEGHSILSKSRGCCFFLLPPSLSLGKMNKAEQVTSWPHPWHSSIMPRPSTTTLTLSSIIQVGSKSGASEGNICSFNKRLPVEFSVFYLNHTETRCYERSTAGHPKITAGNVRLQSLGWGQERWEASHRHTGSLRIACDSCRLHSDQSSQSREQHRPDDDIMMPCALSIRYQFCRQRQKQKQQLHIQSTAADTHSRPKAKTKNFLELFSVIKNLVLSMNLGN